ncbi:putative photosynthetic complex assembly protein PuhE [Blastomonas sp.]|uniref:putative photosynthetic complex assembly protein PuhE n=1 Tax=Blastomonas sp. TaxID=1909299 RepID=UPI00391DB255
MSLYGHILPALVVLIAWFGSTGVVAWLANRGKDTFARSISWAGFAAGICLCVIVYVGHGHGASGPDAMDAYISFGAALVIWGWLELTFLTGIVAGPRRIVSDPLARGWRRFSDAAATLIYHELAIAAVMVILVSLTWDSANPTGTVIFSLLFALRLSAKLNLFVGVPNMSDEIMPGHLEYLKSYFGPRRLHGALAFSLVALLALSLYLGMRALAAPADSFAAVSGTLVFTLAALGSLEHLFLALPFRDGALWRWAIPATDKDKKKESGYGL